jgi:hypothetical protein
VSEVTTTAADKIAERTMLRRRPKDVDMADSGFEAKAGRPRGRMHVSVDETAGRSRKIGGETRAGSSAKGRERTRDATDSKPSG